MFSIAILDKLLNDYSNNADNLEKQQDKKFK